MASASNPEPHNNFGVPKMPDTKPDPKAIRAAKRAEAQRLAKQASARPSDASGKALKAGADLTGAAKTKTGAFRHRTSGGK